jgi:RNA polymerase II subunit A small phosphatase-like protein
MEKKSNKLIIFDLDETLIHASFTELSYPAHFMFDKYFVYERPGVRSFLHNIAQHFTIGIWSSASDEYVAEIVGHITRWKCYLHKGVYWRYQRRGTSIFI